jgi:hypothetical protein
MVLSVWPDAVECVQERANFMSIIKAYNTLEHLLVTLHRKIQKCSLQLPRRNNLNYFKFRAGKKDFSRIQNA